MVDRAAWCVLSVLLETMLFQVIPSVPPTTTSGFQATVIRPATIAVKTNVLSMGNADVLAQGILGGEYVLATQFGAEPQWGQHPVRAVPLVGCFRVAGSRSVTGVSTRNAESSEHTSISRRESRQEMNTGSGTRDTAGARDIAREVAERDGRP
jgi:hypothetical protein